MKVTLYTRKDCEECSRVWDMLALLAVTEDFELHEGISPEGAPAPCVRFDAPGVPFYKAQGLTEDRFLVFLNEARSIRKAADEREESTAARRTRNGKRPGAAPDADYEEAHPVRSFLWRHRVGAMVSSLSVFVGLSWVAPLTPSLGLGTGFYNTVHSIYRLVCDQVPERSAQLGGLPVCLCWRCTAIYLGALFFGIAYTVTRDRKIDALRWLTRPVSLVVMLLFGLPLILDGATHALGFRPDISYAHSADFWLSWEPLSADWWLRIGTALLATIGAVKFLCPRLDKLGFVYEKLYRVRKLHGQRFTTGPLGTARAAD